MKVYRAIGYHHNVQHNMFLLAANEQEVIEAIFAFSHKIPTAKHWQIIPLKVSRRCLYNLLTS